MFSYFVLEYVSPPLSSSQEYGMYNCAEADTMAELEEEFGNFLKADQRPNEMMDAKDSSDIVQK